MSRMQLMLSVRKRPLLVPEPGQRVRLRTGRGRWRGSYRAISEPFTDDMGVVVLRVAEEEEYRKALPEGRSVMGTPWPVRQVVVVQSSAGPEEKTGELPKVRRQRPGRAAQRNSPTTLGSSRQGCVEVQESAERPWWRRLFGG